MPMETCPFRVLALCLAILTGALTLCAAQPQSGYKVTKHISVGGAGGWDYVTFDPQGQRLFIARSTRVQIVDLKTEKLTAEIPNTNGVHGVALVEKLGRGVTSNGRDDTATIFDLKSLAPIATVKTGGKPDAILLEDRAGMVWTMNGRSNDITVIDPAAAKAVATIALPGRPEFAVSDGAGKVFVNLEDKNQVAVVDANQRKTVATYELAGCNEPTGLAIDRKASRLFSGCHNGVLVVMDAASGKNVAKLPIGQGVDVTAYDTETKLVFASNGDGTISVIKQLSPDKYESLAPVPTRKGARTMALDPTSHTIYAVASTDASGGQGGSFQVLVVQK